AAHRGARGHDRHVPAPRMDERGAEDRTRGLPRLVEDPGRQADHRDHVAGAPRGPGTIHEYFEPRRRDQVVGAGEGAFGWAEGVMRMEIACFSPFPSPYLMVTWSLTRRSEKV